MTYQPKVVRCRLKTGGKSIEELRVQYAGQGLVYRDFENIQRANEHFDGLVILLSLWDYDNGEYYHLYSWEKTDDEKMMMGIYYAEQTHPVPGTKMILRDSAAIGLKGNMTRAAPLYSIGRTWKNWK